jgi:O-antigen ligase
MKIFALVLERLGFFLMMCCVAFAPIPLGSNSDGYAGLLGVGLAGALLAALAAPLPNRSCRRLVAAALALAVALASWSALQVAHLDATPWSNPIWQKTRDLIGDAHGAIAAARYQPLHSLGYVLLPFAAFVSALVYVRDAFRYTRFLNIVIATGVIVTIISIGQHLYLPGTLLWAKKQHYLGSFTGTFVNPNTAATYFGVVMLMALAAGLRQVERIGVRRLLAGSLHDPTGGDSVRWGALTGYLGAASVFLVALMLTQSRAGIMASLAGAAFLLGAFVYLAARRRTSPLQALGISASALAGIAVVVAAFGGRLLRRLDLEGFVDEGRACTFRSTWHAIKDHFWQGTGLGTFQDVFPRYRLPQCGLYGYWNMAHNVFLEGALNLGVPVFALCGLAFYGLLVATYARGMRERRQARFVPLLCAAVLVTLTLHSLVDFSLQIPAVAVLVGSVLGAGAAISLGRADGKP